MLINSSSTCNDSDLHQQPSSIPFYTLYIFCLITKPSSVIFTVFNVTSILFHLPLSIIILKHCVQQWQTARNPFSAATSHSDCFTYNMVTMELIGVFGCLLNCYGVYKEDTAGIMQTGTTLLTFTWFGEAFFHLLTCLERYLAAIHPITYMCLRNERGIRMRNISIGCVWLLSSTGMLSLQLMYFTFVNFFLLIISITAVSYCSFSVLYVLIRPGPGEQSRERVDQSKQRAFYTILVILGVLAVRFAWGLTWAILFKLEKKVGCVVMTVDVWFNLPSTLVLPLLFLHRKGLFCKISE